MSHLFHKPFSFTCHHFRFLVWLCTNSLWPFSSHPQLTSWNMMFFNLTKGKKEKKEKKESLRHSYELVNYRPPAGALSMKYTWNLWMYNVLFFCACLNPPKPIVQCTIKTSTSFGFQAYIIRTYTYIFWGGVFSKQLGMENKTVPINHPLPWIRILFCRKRSEPTKRTSKPRWAMRWQHHQRYGSLWLMGIGENIFLNIPKQMFLQLPTPTTSTWRFGQFFCAGNKWRRSPQKKTNWWMQDLKTKACHKGKLGGGFKYFLFSTPFGEDEPILTSIFFKWVGLKPPPRKRWQNIAPFLFVQFYWTSRCSPPHKITYFFPPCM